MASRQPSPSPRRRSLALEAARRPSWRVAAQLIRITGPQMYVITRPWVAGYTVWPNHVVTCSSLLCFACANTQAYVLEGNGAAAVLAPVPKAGDDDPGFQPIKSSGHGPTPDLPETPSHLALSPSPLPRSPSLTLALTRSTPWAPADQARMVAASTAPSPPCIVVLDLYAHHRRTAPL